MGPHLKFHLKFIVWHIKIDILTALWIKWDQNEEKFYRLIFSSIESFWSSFKISYSILVMIYQNRSFSWSINDTLRKYVEIECFWSCQLGKTSKIVGNSFYVIVYYFTHISWSSWATDLEQMVALEYMPIKTYSGPPG